MIKRLEAIIEVLKSVNGDYYWLKASQKQYNLSNGQMGYIVHRLRKDGVI